MTARAFSGEPIRKWQGEPVLGNLRPDAEMCERIYYGGDAIRLLQVQVLQSGETRGLAEPGAGKGERLEHVGMVPKVEAELLPAIAETRRAFGNEERSLLGAFGAHPGFP